jgi:predicted nuclease of predicted toxin-antitoxin system
VRFLIDAQLPPAIARELAVRGHEADHVADLGLASAPDRRIWDRALATGAVLVTKDEDFVTMRALSTADAPAIVWVRIGNATRRALLGRFFTALPTLLDALARGETVVQLSEH